MGIGLIKEINKEYIEAVRCYESEIKNNNASVLPDDYINLAFLYWSFAFELFEFNIPNSIKDDYSIIGGNSFQNILYLGLSKYPNNTELHFWREYFQHIIYGKGFSENDCKKLIEKYGDNESNVPYFFLYLFNKEKYEEKRNELIDVCNKQPTAKNIYIKSIIA